MPESIKIKDVPAMRVLSYRTILLDPSYIGPLFATASEAVARTPVPLAPADWMALYHHDEYREENLDFELALPVAPEYTGSLDLGEGRIMRVRSLPAQKMACIEIQLRQQADVLAGNQSLARWIEAHGYVYEDAPCREVYGNPPEPDGSIIFESQFPVKRSGN